MTTPRQTVPPISWPARALYSIGRAIGASWLAGLTERRRARRDLPSAPFPVPFPAHNYRVVREWMHAGIQCSIVSTTDEDGTLFRSAWISLPREHPFVTQSERDIVDGIIGEQRFYGFVVAPGVLPVSAFSMNKACRAAYDAATIAASHSAPDLTEARASNRAYSEFLATSTVSTIWVAR